MPTDVNTNTSNVSSDDDGFSWNETLNSDGTESDEEDEEETDNTDENVQYNDPAKNRKLSEVTIAEQIRETFNLTITIPRVFKGLHTNQFFFMDVSDDFYEANYPTIIEAIANKKYARYAGFQKGRFFVEKMKESGGVDGWKTEITLNPIPPSLAVWSKMQQEATKALIQAINQETGGGASNNTSGGGLGGTAAEIGNALAEKYGFCSGVVCPDPGGGESYEEMKQSGSGSCYAWSDALYTELNAAGIKARIIQYGTSYASNHRSVQIEENGNWVDYPYSEIKRESVRKYAGATKSKPGMFVFKEPPGGGSSD